MALALVLLWIITWLTPRVESGQQHKRAEEAQERERAEELETHLHHTHLPWSANGDEVALNTPKHPYDQPNNLSNYLNPLRSTE
jgi:hypothetical protein